MNFISRSLNIKDGVISKGLNGKRKAAKAEEINEFVEGIDLDTIVVMEATGNYHRRLADSLYNRGIVVYVENPRYIKHYGKMRNNISKTDKNDAYLIASYGERNLKEMKAFTPPREDIEDMKQRRMVIEGLKKRLQQINGQLESLSQLLRVDKLSKAMLEEEQEEIKSKIAKLQESLEEDSGSDIKKYIKILLSLPGIGKIIATEFAEVLMGFVGMDNPNASKQFVKFIGLAPSIHESGKSVRKGGHITRSGAPSLRAKLFMGATAAVHNVKIDNPFKTFFNRLIEKGKTYKQAMVAVMKKLVRVAFALIRDGVTYDTIKYGLAK